MRTYVLAPTFNWKLDATSTKEIITATTDCPECGHKGKKKIAMEQIEYCCSHCRLHWKFGMEYLIVRTKE
jgi:DNA-directed RNA polymerase subunit RPC12/RpoP